LRSEVNLIEAYTASLKGAAIVSSSQQITNYYKFAETASANIFYNYQAISGSKLELHTSDANGGIVVNSKASTSQTFMTFIDKGTNDNSVVGTFVDINGTNSLGGLAVVGHRKDNQSGLVLRGQNKVANSGAVNGYITSVIGNAYSDNALTTLTTGVTGKSISFLGQDTELANLNFNGDLTITNGNLVVASGKGIDFSATSNSGGTTTSELFDDYEYGTFTPIVSDAVTSGNTATGTFTGTYTKIGRQVIIGIGLSSITTSGMTAGNTIYIQGLPFTGGSSQTSPGVCNFYDVNIGNNNAIAWYNSAVSSTALRILKQSPTTNSALIVSDITSGTGEITLSITYFV